MEIYANLESDDKTKIELNRECLKPLLKKTDAIIYEANVRDYTMYDNCSSKYKGKFKGNEYFYE